MSVRLRRLVVAVVPLVLASGAAVVAASAPLVQVRGAILGKTPRSIDIRIGAGAARMDQRLEMPERPQILVAVPSDRAMIGANAVVGIVTDGDGPGARTRELVVFSNSPRATGDGHAVWDLPHGHGMAKGRVARRMGRDGWLVITLLDQSRSRRVAIAPMFRSSRSRPAP